MSFFTCKKRNFDLYNKSKEKVIKDMDIVRILHKLRKMKHQIESIGKKEKSDVLGKKLIKFDGFN